MHFRHDNVGQQKIDFAVKPASSLNCGKPVNRITRCATDRGSHEVGAAARLDLHPRLFRRWGLRPADAYFLSSHVDLRLCRSPLSMGLNFGAISVYGAFFGFSPNEATPPESPDA